MKTLVCIDDRARSLEGGPDSFTGLMKLQITEYRQADVETMRSSSRRPSAAEAWMMASDVTFHA